MLDWLTSRFKKPTQTLDDIPLEELRREQVRLEQQEKKLVKEIDDLENKKKALFAEGKAADGSTHRQRSIAQRIVSVDREVKMTDRKLRTISKQLQAVNNFVYLKQSKRELEQSGLFGMINQMDLEDLDAWIEKASIDGELNVSKLEDMLQRVSSNMGLASEIEEDPEIAQIMAMFQSEGASETLGDDFTETFASFDDEKH